MYLECFNDRNLGQNVFGDSLSGNGLNAGWLEDGPRAYYTFFCLALAIAFFGVGFAPSVRSIYNPHFQLWVCLYCWILSILVAYIGYIFGGVTWMVLSLGLLHNAAEAVISFLLIQINREAKLQQWKSKTSLFILLLFAIFWLSEVIWTFSVGLTDAYVSIAAMGGLLDTFALICWLSTFLRRKCSIWPLISFGLHQIYVFGIIFNCFIVPWGRLLGLAVNTLAIGCLTVPVLWKPILSFPEEDGTESNTSVELPEQEKA